MPREKRRFAVKRTTIGLGLFTLEPIPRHQRIIEYKGRIITSQEADKIGGKYLFEINEKYYIDGRVRTNLARYLNHSCRPNAEVYVSGKRIWLWSKRAIRAGEEITFHYGKAFIEEYLTSLGIKCKCIKCREKEQKKSGS